jgi:outer membrane protein assembly factor BamB
MHKPSKRTLLMFLAVITLFTACKKKMQPPEGSEDDPLPVQDYPSVIINSNNQILYAIDPSTGKKNWEMGLPTPNSADPSIYGQFTPSPLLYKNRLYVATGVMVPANDTLYKINPRTGAIIKKIDVVPNSTSGIQATPIGDANLIYVATYSGWLYAIDTGNYETKWKFQADGPLVATPTISGSIIYFASTAGTVYAINKTDGTYSSTTAPYETWSINIPGASFYSSPVTAAPYIYVGSGSVTDSNMYCIYLKNDASTATIRWQYKTRGAIFSSPAFINGKLIFGCNDFRLYCLDTFLLAGQAAPAANWIDSFASEIYSSPYVSGQTVYVGCKDYKTYSLALLDGRVKWSHQSNGLIKSSPVCYHGLVYVGSYDKVLYALDSAKGTPKWSFPINGQMLCSPVIDDLSGTRAYQSGISGMTNYGAN